MSRRNKRRKPVPVLTPLEAMAKLRFKGFQYDVYESTFEMLEERFGGKILRDEGFRERFYKGFKKKFTETYLSDEIRMVRLYKKEFKRTPETHFPNSLERFVVDYLYNELELFWCEGNFTSGQGGYLYPI